ncbi:MAG: phosphoenolpyruvate synthase [Nevskia sp.]|nr:phosphoenolpyruvate synthase [Nevskia sp.]
MEQRPASSRYVTWFEDIALQDVPRVGGKNASLGELLGKLKTAGVRVPDGFAATAEAYWAFVDANHLRPLIAEALAALKSGRSTLEQTGAAIRSAFLAGSIPDELADALRRAYAALSPGDAAVAVRSSATAEDLPTASFAGQHESFLNVAGEAALLDACRRCYASLFTDRAITYRQANGFDHFKVALSIGVQRMVRADLGGAGVMFSIDTETGFDRIVLINAAWGLGESVVQGAVDPDEYEVFKPLLDNPALAPIVRKRCGGKALKIVYDADHGGSRSVPTDAAERGAYVLDERDILALARWACAIERHYRMPMDVEWAKDGQTGELLVVQARPETVQSRRQSQSFRTYAVRNKGRRLAAGLAIGEAAVSAKVCVIESPHDIGRFTDGAVLVASTTDPDWGPVMKRAAAIVTDHGGRTSHAAIVSRELGLPAVVGTGNATAVLKDGQEVTVSCAEGDDGFVYEGAADIEATTLSFENLPATRTQVMLNLGNPASAFRWWRLPADGIGLMRMEFVISNAIKVHPMALIGFDTLADPAARAAIEELTRGYANKPDYFVDRLAQGLARIAAAYHPKPVIVRMSDFKTNEYANLIGGAGFESKEENPMLGFRGASRYYSPRYQPGFELECRAIARLRRELGFRNVVVMIPFCRTLKEADQVLAVMAAAGLRRGEDGLQVYVMCEIPSNVILAQSFARRFDGFSIGSNDLTQLTLGVDRDSEELADLFDERDEAVSWMIRKVITDAHAVGAKVGICGQAPSDHPEFAEFLVDCGIDSISVSPDSFLAVKQRVVESENRRLRGPRAKLV